MYEKPLVVHSDGHIYLMEWQDPDGQLAQKLTEFSDRVKSPEEVNTFYLSPYALWSAAAKDIEADHIIRFLNEHCENQIDKKLINRIREDIEQFGQLRLKQQGKQLILKAHVSLLIENIKSNPKIAPLIVQDISDHSMLIFKLEDRIRLLIELFDMHLFVIDETDMTGDTLDLQLKKKTIGGADLKLRDYQNEAVDMYLQHSPKAGKGGVILAPPYSGKTLIALKIIELLKKRVLIIVENEAGASSWLNEIKDKTSLPDDLYTFIRKDSNDIKPLTVCTYSHLSGNHRLFKKVHEINWGIIIFDDAHKSLADTFQDALSIPSEYKLAIASTLARADKRGNQIFALVGPKWLEVLPRELENRNFLSPVTCVEVKVPLSVEERENYDSESLTSRNSHNLRSIAAMNSNKIRLTKYVLQHYWNKKIIIVSYKIDLAKKLSGHHNISMINRSSNLNDITSFDQEESTRLICTSVVEKLPIEYIDILVAVSYHGSSEREEYLRLGKVLAAHPNKRKGYFISAVTPATVEEEDFKPRRKAIINYGYRYRIVTLDDLLQRGSVFESD
ncbi:DEAD/DEAH box helicase family protein [Heliobacterium gestii]|uniref:DNA 3'-5' helicase n=1 Tax=Heliomicrobium gestii TaxID=2699 RepID=A0A845LA37_HELGE|nr:helicase-associated domain-containing protein [Heliomicrobium gestii]MBM7865549.1 DNA excision repair protein ERCC-3 [Heliomicrobium gestii]MZP41800.1 DEAD/DEAH box helicase family protein [Heliomicrobium gestii]